MLTTRIPIRRGAAMVAVGLALVLTACTPPGPRALLDGERLLQKGRPRDAVRRLQTAVEFLPGNAQAWNHLGLAQHAARQPGEALRAYQHAIRLDARLGAAHFNLGHLWLEQGRPDEAAESFRSYIAIEPESAEGWRAHGQALLRVREWGQAERSFGTALRLRAGDVEALNGLGIALQQQRRAREAWQCFSEAAQREPGFAPAWLNLAVAAQQLGARPQAVEAYRRYTALRPEAARSLGIAAILRHLETPPAVPDVPGAAALPVAGATPLTGTAGPSSTPAVPEEPTQEPTAAPVQLAATRAGTSLPPESSQHGGTIDAPPPVRLEPPPPTAPSPSIPSELPPSAPTRAVDARASAGIDSRSTAPGPRVDPDPVEPDPAPAPATAAVEVPEVNVVEEPLPPPAVPDRLVAAVEPPPVAVTEAVEDRMSEPPLRVLPQVGLRLPPEPTPPPTPVPPVTLAVEGPAPEPLQVVEVPVPAGFARETRDEAWAPVLPGVSSEGTATGDEATREVGIARPDADAAERRRFWSRANPMQWFASDGRSVEPGPSAGEDREASEAGRWRWVNPTTWFRSEDGAERASDREVAATQAEVDRSAPVVDGMGIPLLTEPSIRVVRVPSSPGPADVMPGRLEGVEPMPGAVREIPRYVYQRPNRPATGDRAAARPVMLLGIQEHRRGRMESAVTHYTEVIRLDPAAYEAYRNLATVHLQTGDWSRSLDASEWALSLDPDSLSARLTFALALERAGYPTDAAIEAERIVTTDPDHVAAHLLLGNLYAQRLGNGGRARAHYLRVIELDPEHSQSLAIRRWLAGRR
ncbi:MAG: tetratricopeptide repeat protein [Verrucomicrobiae bacterium]|nr:tetratricopeptide repeat protein [Verrucomicrobiae bacterium]